MTREALAAALDPAVRDYGWLKVLEEAASERLAQLPEKCGHDEKSQHSVNLGQGGVLGPVGQCPGKVYPAELVERIALVLFPISGLQEPDGHIEAFRVYAVAVLDSLNGTSE